MGSTVLVTIAAIVVFAILIYLINKYQRRRNAEAGINQSQHTQDEFFDYKGPGGYNVAAVGESNYQDALRFIVGARDGYVTLHFTAHLYCEDDNPYDSNAVRVMIGSRKVGYLSRDHAAFYRSVIRDAGFGKATAKCQAKVYGGGEEKPSYGVWLDI